MSSAKTITVIGLLAKIEASYNAGGSLSTSTDGIQLNEWAEFSPEYANDGARAAPPGTTGYQRRVASSGRTGSPTFKIEPKGAGAAYSASVVPHGHVLRRAAGFDAAVTTTGGSEKWDYTPSAGPTGYASLVASLYGRGELYPFTGVYLDYSVGADGPVIPIEEYAAHGLLGDATDVSVPTITYPLGAIDPPKSVGASLFSLGNFTGAILRKWSFKLGRTIGPRLNQNTAAGHAGFGVVRRTPQLEVTVEATTRQTTPFHAATAIDPDKLYDAATSLAVAINIGSTQYNRWKLTGPAAQIMTPPRYEGEADNGAAVWSLTLQLNPSAINLNDEVKITYD